MTLSLRNGVVVLIGSMLAACGGSEEGASTNDAQPDSATDVVAVDTSVDSTTDSGAEMDGGVVVIGAPCTGTTDCAGVCITDPRFTRGYCSIGIAECAAPGGTFDPCPSGSSCTNGLGFDDDAGHGDFCLSDCATDSDCRVADGYACCGRTHTGKLVCIPRSYCPVDAGP